MVRILRVVLHWLLYNTTRRAKETSLFVRTLKQSPPVKRKDFILRRVDATRICRLTLHNSLAAPEVESTVLIASHGDLTYRMLKQSDPSWYFAASTGAPVVMIHPVGIGMAAWFWSKVFAAWSEISSAPVAAQSSVPAPKISSPLYALNLRGCASQDARAANSSVDVSSPLSLQRWVLDTADFISNVVLSPSVTKARPTPFGLPFFQRNAPPAGCHLVVQGGLAPLGIVLAQEYPYLIRSLTLTSPPEELTVADDQEVAKNLMLLSSPLGNAAIDALLENPVAIRAFSNLFLFDRPCDTEWVEQANAEACTEVRKAVQFFNAGGCCRVAASDVRLSQPLLVLEGGADPRKRRSDYVSQAPAIEFRTVPGKNVLPWEAPFETARAIQQFTSRL